MSKHSNKLYCKLATLAAIAIVCSALFVMLPGTINASSTQEHSIVPEYKRTLHDVVLSLSVGSTDYSSLTNLISSFPQYSEVIILLPNEIANSVNAQVVEPMSKQGHTVRLAQFKTSHIDNADVQVLSSRKQKLLSRSGANVHMPNGTIWAQDLFEVASSGNGHYILAPDIHKWFIDQGTEDSDSRLSDNSFVSELSPLGYEVKKLPITFKGGNVLVDELNGKSIAFCGSDVIWETATMIQGKQSGTDIAHMLKRHLNVDKVVVIGKGRKQPAHMFHMDQAMVLLDTGVVGVTRIKGKPRNSRQADEIAEVRLFLASLRAKLRNLGYWIVNMDVTVQDALDYRYYVNGVPYLNRDTGKQEFLFPLFESSTASAINRNIVRRNISALESLGYRVITVPTTANKRHGGLHCMVNVIH